MNLPDPTLIDAVDHMLAEHCDFSDASAAEQHWSGQLWRVFEEAEVPRAWVTKLLGGSGFGIVDGMAIVWIAARYAAPVPLAETLLAGWVLSACGIPVPTGAMNVVILKDEETEPPRLLPMVQFANDLEHLVVVSGNGPDTRVCLLPRDTLEIGSMSETSIDPCGSVRLPQDTAARLERTTAISVNSVARVGATIRAQQMAGALDHVLSRSVEYAQTRVQFGRPIAKFQAVQQSLAELAGEVAAASAAANAAAGAIERHGETDPRSFVAVSSAKIRCGQAATKGAAIGHQVHGAIGFAREYPLHLYTRRLWSWRDDYGTETEWAEQLGSKVLADGVDSLWRTLTRA